MKELYAIITIKCSILKERINYYSHKYFYDARYNIIELALFDYLNKEKIQTIRNKYQISSLIWKYRDVKDREFISILLNNTLNSLDSYPKVKTFSDKFSINLTDSIYKKFIVAQNFVSVQPMNGPVGLAFVLRLNGKKTESGSIEQLSLAIERVTVQAHTRALQAVFNGEASEDLSVFFGGDKKTIENEMMEILSHEISFELIKSEVLDNIEKYAEQKTIDLTSYDYAKRADAAVIELRRTSNQIAAQTRRGAGNVIIVTPELLAYLQNQSEFFSFESVNDIQSSGCITYVGKWENYKVFVDPYASGTSAIVLYKGNSVYDGGLIIAPYMLNSSFTSIDEQTYIPSTRFNCRVGFTKNKSDLINPSNYYKKITFKFEEDK